MLTRYSNRSRQHAPTRPKFGLRGEFLWLCMLLAGCNQDDLPHTLETELANAKWTVQKAEAEQAELVHQLVKEPTAQNLLTLLAKSHQQARILLGPHRLNYSATFSLHPEQLPELPEVDRPRPRAYDVVDQLTLTWASQGDESMRFHLTQGNEQVDRREIIVIDDRVYSRLPFEPWFVHPQESDVYERWLDDAQRSLFDMIEFAAPQLKLTTREEANETLVVTLEQSGEIQALISASPPPNRQWRSQVKFTKITGNVVIHPRLGLWMAGDIDLAYQLENSDKQLFFGTLHWSGRVETLPGKADLVTAPTSAEPIPERLRYELEKTQLLDGLAGLR